MGDLKWTTNTAGELALCASVPGVSALYPVADIIAALKANPEACAEVRTALDPYAYAVRDDAIARAESAERERDALKAKLAEAERSFAGYNAKLHAEALRENDVLRSRASAAEAVVEAARYELRAAISSANGIDHDGPGSASFSRIFPEDAYPTTEPEADAFVKARMRLWLHTWVTAPMRRALDALDGSALDAAQAKDSGGASGASPAMVADAEPTPEPAGGYVLAPPRVDPADLADEPITRADLDALEERIVERVLFALNTTHGFASYAQANHERFDLVDALYSLADELRRKV